MVFLPEAVRLLAGELHCDLAEDYYLRVRIASSKGDLSSMTGLPLSSVAQRRAGDLIVIL